MILKSEIGNRKPELRIFLRSGFRLLISALVVVTTSACGFRPLYGRFGANPGAQQIFSSIYVQPIDNDRAGYDLRNTLIDLLEARAVPQNATYRLDIDLREHREGSAVQNEVVAGVNETSITRYNYSLVADYRLLDAKGGVVTKGTATTLSAYNVVTSPYATLIGQQDAQKRAAEDIAARIRLDLGVYFANGGHP
jgi:LPS-assembly lipoprotein